MKKEYAIRVYEDYSIDNEKYVLYHLDRAVLDKEISKCLKQNCSFQVIVFDREV